MRSDAESPAHDGLYMPAEWEPHERCWMQWPTRGDLWGERLPEAYMAYAAVARTIAAFEPVTMVVSPDDAAQARLACGRDVEIAEIRIDDSWARDTGPVFVADGDGGVAGVHWEFNAWGNEYQHYDNDALVGGKILDRLRMRSYRGPMVLEGGSISVDGHGTLLTTEECLLNLNRNPMLNRQQIEERLALFLGIRKVIWLDQGLADDETNGHVDNVACFTPAGVLLHSPKDRDDPSYERMQENLFRLSRAKSARGSPLTVIEVPAPRPEKRQDGRWLARSYINFYIANGGLVIPRFGDPADDDAAEIIAAAFPGRKMERVDGSVIVEGGGCVHCITQQQPKGSPLPQKRVA